MGTAEKLDRNLTIILVVALIIMLGFAFGMTVLYAWIVEFTVQMIRYRY